VEVRKNKQKSRKGRQNILKKDMKNVVFQKKRLKEGPGLP
jgi:hypothetical protein